jgi:hypothetical protein
VVPFIDGDKKIGLSEQDILEKIRERQDARTK